MFLMREGVEPREQSLLKTTGLSPDLTFKFTSEMYTACLYFNPLLDLGTFDALCLLVSSGNLRSWTPSKTRLNQ